MTILFNLLNELTNYIKTEDKKSFIEYTKLPQYVKIILQAEIDKYKSYDKDKIEDNDKDKESSQEKYLEVIDSYIDIIIDEVFAENEKYLHNVLFNYFLKHNLQDKLIMSTSVFIEEFIEKMYKKNSSPNNIELMFKYYHHIKDKQKAFKYLLHLCEFRTDSMDFNDSFSYFKVSDLLPYFQLTLNYINDFQLRDN